MIAIPSPAAPSEASAQQQFLEVLPKIRSVISFAFHTRPKQHREELAAQALAHCWIAFTRLLRQGKDPMQFPTALARFATRRAVACRPVGHLQNSEDLASAMARGEIEVVGLEDRAAPGEEPWKELLVEKKAFPPPDVVAARLDVASWLDSLPARRRRIAETLAMGERTSVVAGMFGISLARVSQIRGELRAAWQKYQGEAEADDQGPVAN